MTSLHETCQQYVARRLSEGWKIISREGFNVVLQSPEGIIRPVDLRNDVLTLRPSAAGSETSIDYQYPSGGEHWDKVDEADADDDTTYVNDDGMGVYVRDLYNIPDHTTETGTINFIRIYFRCKKESGIYNGYAKPSLRSNSTVTDGTQITLTTSWVTYSQQWNTNPADDEEWEWTDIDALQIGVSLKPYTPYGTVFCTQVYVEVDYSAAVAHEKTLTESLGLVDKVVKAPSVVKAEPLGLLDTYGRTWAIYRTYTELLGLTDTVIVTRLLVKVLTELLGLSDTVKKDTSKMLAENLGLLDVYSRTWSVYRTYEELLGLADSIKKDVALHPLVESLGLVDSVVKSPSITRDELLGLKDSIVKDTSVTKSELLGLVDTIVKEPGKQLSETLGLLDAVTKSASIIKVESLGLDDRVSKHVSLHALTEVLGLLDSISYFKNPTVLAKLIRKMIQLEDIGGGGS